MAEIKYQDTDGTKSTLPVGVLGYDNYPAGGDAGRVYIGDGSSNLPIAFKSEVNLIESSIDEVDGKIETLNGYTTLAEYGITDAYTKTEVVQLLEEQDEASEISYSNIDSTFTSVTVKEVIDEIDAKKLNITDADSLVATSSQSTAVAMAIVFGN